MLISPEKVKTLAHEAGFDLCGITSAAVIRNARKQFFGWIEAGLHGEMSYLEKEIERRCDPSLLLPGARSIIVLGLNYYQPNDPIVPEGRGRVSRYARGRDYHKVLEKKMKSLTTSLSRVTDRKPDPTFKRLVDYGPMLERSYAEKAGLGFIGKNGMLINKRYGSWLFLAQIVTDLEIEPDTRDPISHGKCGSCRLCIEACPTGAIVSPRKVDSRRCISYLTIEKPARIPAELEPLLGDLVFGCDICQEVCPCNEAAILTSHEQVLPEQGVGEFLDLNQVMSLETREEFLKLTAGTPLTRPRLDGLKRDAEIVSRNRGHRQD